MNQFWVVVLAAVLIGGIAVGVGSAYVSSTSAKMPEQNEMIQLFVSGALVGGFIGWLISSGYLHGSALMGMVTSDVKAGLKEVGLKGGDEMAVAAASAAVPTGSMLPTAAGVTQMVGGFLNSMGMKDALQELNVGMPGF